jgi:hypothetical protein
MTEPAYDHQHRNGSVRQDVNDGRAEIVVTVSCAARVSVFLEDDRVSFRPVMQADNRNERVRFGNVDD